MIDWKQWHRQLQSSREEQKGAEQQITIEELTKLEEKDVFNMVPDRLDQYFDFYADTFLDEAEIQRTMEADDFRNAVYGMFPIESASAASANQDSNGQRREDDTAMVRAVHSSMQARAAVDDEHAGTHILRPGQSYRVYKKEKDMPDHAKAFYEEVAKLAGMSMDMLMMAVFFTETRMEKWRREQKDSSM